MISPSPSASPGNASFKFSISPMTPVFEGPLTHVTELKRTDMQELLDHQHLLDPSDRTLLELVRRKPEIYPNRFFDPDYLPNATLLVASSYPGAKRHAFCGVPTSVSKDGRCRDHKFCPRCNYLVREDAARAYVPAFDNGNWHFVTLSFSGSLPFDSANIGAIADCWDACKETLQFMRASGHVEGVHWTEELAVLSFLPLQVMPHVHALVDARDFGDEQAGLLLLRLSNWRNASGEGLALAPDIDIRPISTQRSLLDRLRYLYKPIQLARAYENAWGDHLDDSRSRAWELNSQARELAAGIFDVRKRRNRMNSEGTLNPRAKGFIGVAKAERAAQSDLIRELQQQPAEYPEDETGFAE